MTEYGVTATGFVKKTLAIIRDEVQTELRDTISSELNLLDSSVLGQVEGIISDKLRECWDVMLAIYRAMYPDSASDEALDEVCSFSGLTRQPQTKGTVTLDQLWLDDGTTIPVGSIVRVGATGPRWVTTAAVSNATGATATVSTTAEAEDYGEVPGYAESIDTIVTPIAGWNAKAAVSGTVVEGAGFALDGDDLDLEVDEDGNTQTVSFPVTGGLWTAADTATEINDNTTGITAADDGLGYVRIASDTDGSGSAIEIIASDVATTLGLPVGLVKGFNTEDADVGDELETDPDLRARRAESLRAIGSATVEAIYSALVLLEDIERVSVLENTTNAVDANGLPPKSFECIILADAGAWAAGLDDTVGETIWAEKPAGIQAYGTESVTITDSQGFDHDIYYSKPTEVRIYIAYTLTTDSDLYPSDGDDQVKAAAVALAATLGQGDDVIALAFRAAALTIAGVEDVPTFVIDTTAIPPGAGTTNISIGVRQIATVDTADITVA